MEWKCLELTFKGNLPVFARILIKDLTVYILIFNRQIPE